MPSPQQNRVAALCPPSRNCLVQYVGMVRRWEGAFKKFWITCLLEYGWAACEGMCMRPLVCIAVYCYCSRAWVSWWLGSSGTSLDFLSPHWATVGLAIWMDLLKNGNMTGLWELPLVEDLLSLNLRWCGYDFLISTLSKNVLVSSLTRWWITATKFGCDINALFDNVCSLWFLSKWFRVFSVSCESSLDWKSWHLLVLKLTLCVQTFWLKRYCDVKSREYFLENFWLARCCCVKYEHCGPRWR